MHSLCKQLIHGIDQGVRQSLHVYTMTRVVDAAQVEIEHAADVAVVIVVLQTRSKLAMQGQHVDRVLQIVTG